MRLPRLPRLPVSRRRHEDRIERERARCQGVHDMGDDMASEADRLERERDEAREAFYAVRAERDRASEDAAQLEMKLDKRTRERDEARARVAELEQAIRSHRDYQFPEGSHDAVQRFEQAMTVNRRLWSVLDGHESQEPDRYRLVQDGERSFRAVLDPGPGAYPDPLREADGDH